MTIDKLPLTYAEFERSMMTELRAFKRVHEQERLVAAAELLRGLVERSPRQAISSRRATVFAGWLLPGFEFSLSARTLHRLNPAYALTIDRLPRPELGRRSNWFRAGFEITAIAGESALPYRFAVTGRHGGQYDLMGSNSDAEFAHSLFPRPSVRHDSSPVGFLDRVYITPLADDKAPETWLGAFAHTHPQRLFDLLDSPFGRFAAADVARLVGTFACNARWADKFRLTAFGAGGSYSSDLIGLPVVVPNPTPPADPEGMRLPVGTEVGAVVRFSAGSSPLRVPSTTWLHLENAIVQDGGTVRTDDGLIVYESSAHPATDFVSGQLGTVFGSAEQSGYALVRSREPAPEVIDEGILLAGRNDSNWFHWLIEYLPRVLEIPEELDNSIPLLVTNRTPASGFEALSALTSRRLLTIDPNFAQRVEKLHVVAPPVQVLDTTKVPWSDGLSVNPEPLVAMRRAFGITTHSPPTRRVFLNRNSRHRGLVNEQELAVIAERHGLETVDPGALDFASQVALFSSAELLVGASGAVMANYLLLSAESRVIGMTSRGLSDFVLPAAIAAIAGASFTYVTGESTAHLREAGDRNQWLQSNFVIDPADFEACLLSELALLEN
jgi:capsular polysaccharide biosynthesis protein